MLKISYVDTCFGMGNNLNNLFCFRINYFSHCIIKRKPIISQKFPIS